MTNKTVLYYFILIIAFSLNQLAYSQETITNYGNIQLHTNAKLGIFGNLTNNGTCSNNLGEIHLAGNTLQNINGTNVIQTYNLYLNNVNNVKLDNELQIANVLTFTNGKIISDRGDISTEFVHFLPTSSYTNASNASCIDGVVRKTGNTSFEFPLGENGLYRHINISAPTATTDHFTAYYKNSDPNAAGYNHSIKDPTIDHISNCEYWILDRTNGNSNVSVTLSYDNLGNATCSGVTNQLDLLVTRWDGTKWKDHGNSSTTGSVNSGTITTLDNVSNFSPFTLASSSSTNPLPVELLNFYAKDSGDKVAVTWSTASELNSDYFIIQKTKDFSSWQNVAEVTAQGYSNYEVNYKEFDYSPFGGTSYYRLRQIDFDGEYEYSNTVAVSFNKTNTINYNIYPNPSSDIINIENIENLAKFNIKNSLGQNISNYSIISSSENKKAIDISKLSRGIYYLVIILEDKTSTTHKITIQ